MSLVSELDVFYDTESRSPAMQMAVDHALLMTSRAPALRFYRWRRPALSFGYFGRFVDAERAADERELVRRWTGGGIVLHGDDLTYCFTAPRTHPVCARPALEIYAALHNAIAHALRRSGTAATLAGANSGRVSEACFANPVQADVIVDGRKVAGAAQRRSRAGLLHQGSIQAGALSEPFTHAFASAVCAHFTPALLSPDTIEQASELAQKKYGTVDWLTMR